MDAIWIFQDAAYMQILHADLTCRYRKQLVFALLTDYYNDKQRFTERNGALMAGYSGISMSNNAVAAYHEGKKPFSKISKEDILKHGINESITFFRWYVKMDLY